MKRRGKVGMLMAAIAMFAIAAIGGCSGGSEHTETTVTRTVNPPPPNYAMADSQPIDTEVPPTTTTTTTTTTSTDRPDSVLGSTLHAVGTVVMLPFRIVGDTLGLIF